MKTQTQVFQPPGPALCSAHKHITLFFFFFFTVNNFSLIFSNENQSDELQYTVLISRPSLTIPGCTTKPQIMGTREKFSWYVRDTRDSKYSLAIFFLYHNKG